MQTRGELRYDGQTVVITGAGAGLGRAYALFFASRGANVVVNDLGGTFRGEGGGNAAADKVVQEIKHLGGKAVANYDDVMNGERIIDTAIQNFGRVDVLINNAGILRDISFKNMKDTDWDLIMNVHVIGSYKCARAAFPYFRKQRYGRLINTASAAGLFGSFGQCNYSAAKLSQIGFTETLAKEGAKYNIMCNVIAPIAASRLTATVLPPEVLDKLKPEWVVPLVAVLVHSSNRSESGGIYEVGAGHMAKFRWERARSALFETGKEFLTAGVLLDNWKAVCDFSQPHHPSQGVSSEKVQTATVISPSSSSSSHNSDYSTKVALIVNGGTGIGRICALQFGKDGAKVVVHDAEDPDHVVEEIKRLGGQAIGVRASAQDGDKLAKTAIDAYGSIDILVNSAAVCEDVPFYDMDDRTFTEVLKTNLRATYRVTKAVWPYMLRQKSGRVVNLSSTSGIYGDESQAAYATATSGILGFSRALALEGKKHNIFVNTIAPDAYTGTRWGISQENRDQTGDQRSSIAALTALLCSNVVPDPVTGRLFEYGSGCISETRWQRTGGHAFPTNVELTPEAVVEKWQIISNFDDGRADHPSDQLSGQGKIMANMNSKQSPPAQSSTPKIDYLAKIEAAKGAKPMATEFTYNDRDVILYNLGVGAKRTDMSLVFEGDKDFQVLPTFGVVPTYTAKPHFTLDDLVPRFNPMKLLHGEQYLEIRSYPIPIEATVVCVPKLVEVIDKGKAAAVTTGTTIKEKSTGRDLFYTESLAFIRDAGGFGGPKKGSDRGAATRTYQPPSRQPDHVHEETTSEDQAALYRLCGDRNPLHIDPKSSKQGGFDVPILHGLCFFGIAGKAVWKTYGPFQNIKVRFASTVLPGQTIRTEMWREGNVVVFQARVKESGKLCISGAGAELVDDVKSKL